MLSAVTRKELFGLGLLALLGGSSTQLETVTRNTRRELLSSTRANRTVHHYLYVLLENKIYVYDMDDGHRLAQTITLPSMVKFIRGTAADVRSHTLYISYGSVTSGGSLLKYDLVNNKVIYHKTYPLGIDSFAITPDGKTIYMPDGDGQSDGIWRMIDTVTGDVRGAIDTGGHAAHNTIVSLNGAHVYMGPRLSNYLVVADTRTNRVISKIGPVKNGVRPFTINGTGTLAFIETSGFLGFQVANISTGQILYTVPVNGFTFNGFNQFAPSHGISLSPDEKELYISDWPHSYVHVFDVSHLPRKGPKKVADIKLHSMGGSESPCVSTNCMKEGWVLHSRDGRFVYIGDAGDVINTATRKSITYLGPLANTRKFLEIDWSNGRPVFATSRYGVGYVTKQHRGPPSQA